MKTLLILLAIALLIWMIDKILKLSGALQDVAKVIDSNIATLNNRVKDLENKVNKHSK